MCVPPINQHSATFNTLIESAFKQQRVNDRNQAFASYLRTKVLQCQACIGGGENPPQCPKSAILGQFFCLDHSEE